MRVRLYCPVCLAALDLPDPAREVSGDAACRKGDPPISFRHSEAVREGARVDRCSRCEKTAFFSQKDFDQRLGCLILAVGAGSALLASRFFGGIWFAPVLLVFVLLDVLLARRIGTVVICYRCDAEYRGVPDGASYRPYDPHIAERDAPVKTVRRMNP